MTPERAARIREVMASIQADCQSDALRIDGAPLSGRTAGELFGGLLASVQALAKAVDAVVGELP